jgi:hypothetical protein
LEVSVEEETLKKVVQHSVATALANMVFPVPGGPTIKTPFHGLRMPWKQKNFIKGMKITLNHAAHKRLWQNIQIQGNVGNTVRNNILTITV